MDFIFIAGPAITTLIFAAFAITTDPQRHPILRNMFFLASLVSVLLLVNISIQTFKAGDWILDNEVFDVATNTTTMSYIEMPSTVSTSADLDNIYLVLGTVIWLTFAYVCLQMLLHALEWMMSSIKSWRGGDDDAV